MVNPLLDAKNSIKSELKKLKVAKSETIGEKRRAVTRQMETLIIHEKALAAFEKYLPKMFHETPNCEKYDELWVIFVDGLRNNCKSEPTYRKGLIFILKCIQKGNERGLWQLDLPTIPLEISREKLPYDDYWFRKSRCFSR